jgi:hypothetical protein
LVVVQPPDTVVTGDPNATLSIRCQRQHTPIQWAATGSGIGREELAAQIKAQQPCFGQDPVGIDVLKGISDVVG